MPGGGALFDPNKYNPYQYNQDQLKNNNYPTPINSIADFYNKNNPPKKMTNGHTPTYQPISPDPSPYTNLIAPNNQTASDPLGIYDQLMRMALAGGGGGGGSGYDASGARNGVNAAYDPQFAYLNKMEANKKATEKGNESAIASIYNLNRAETKKHGSNVVADYVKELTGTQSATDKRKAEASALADSRIAEMTAELTRLGQNNLIADRKQQILNQRDQTLERIGSQGQSLVDNISQMKNANNDWYNQAQEVATGQQNVGIRDQKALLMQALMNIDQSRAGLLSDKAKSLADINAQAASAAASARASSGPNINTILSILGARTSAQKALTDASGSNSQSAAEVAKLIQGGGMNGAKAYANANGLNNNYFNALSDFVSSQANQDSNFNLQSGTSYKYDNALKQYAKDNGLDPAQLMSMWQVYARR